MALVAAEREVLSLRSQLSHRQQHIKLLEQRLLEQSQVCSQPTPFPSPIATTYCILHIDACLRQCYTPARNFPRSLPRLLNTRRPPL